MVLIILFLLFIDNCKNGVRINYLGVEQRKRKRIPRREYRVNGPHHLWHIDGNHKLIRYGMVIHGCIDGSTRTIIYLSIKDNNTSATVLDLFKVSFTHIITSSHSYLLYYL